MFQLVKKVLISCYDLKCNCTFKITKIYSWKILDVPQMVFLTLISILGPSFQFALICTSTVLNANKLTYIHIVLHPLT